MTGLQILGLGRALPAKAVTNDDLSRIVDTNDEWIASRTGIRSRYFAEGEETNTLLATRAAEAAIENAGIDKNEIAFCLVCTFTPDYYTPSVSCGVAGALSLPESTLSFDLNAACSGFLYGLSTAQGLLAGQPDKYALVIGSEIISRLLDMTDRGTCVLFGDGAGAAVVRLSADHPFYFAGGCKPDDKVLYCNTTNPAVKMEGREVFRFAVEAGPKCMDAVLAKSGLSLDDIDYVVCHQANERIIDHIIRHLHADPSKFYKNLQRYGNTSAASIPLALSEMQDEGLIKNGMKILCVGFGAGLTYGGVLLSF